MIFVDESHREFYLENIETTGSQKDAERQALFYALGLTDITRRNVNDLYDFQDNAIKLSGLTQPWQTGTTIRVCRLAFNLYNGAYGQCEEGTDQARNYTPYFLFDNELLPYMLEAVKIRYSVYAGSPNNR